MLEEEQNPQALPETTWEIILRNHWIALGLIAALGAGGNVEWARGALGAFGLLGPILVAAYHYSTERRPEPIVTPYLILMLPWWVIIAIFLAGIPHPAFVAQEFDGQQYWLMQPPPASWLPVSGVFDVSVLQVIFVCGLYAATVNAAIIPQNRLTFARGWVVLCLIAGFLALIGLAQALTSATQIFWFIAIIPSRFFATFPHYSQWCGFAILWMGVTFGLVAWLVHHRSWRALGSDGWLLLFVALLLGASVVVAGDPVHWLLAALVAAVGTFSLAWQTIRERHRGGSPIAIVCIALGCVGLAAAALALAFHAGPSLVYHGNRPGADLHARVTADTLALWHARPLFGWGHSSFPVIYSFYQQADQDGAFWAYARSDILQSLAENGLVGTLAWCFPAAWVVWRFLRARRLASFLYAPLAALVAILFLACVDFPFACPAIFFGFWLILFSACRWNEIDDESRDTSLTIRRRLSGSPPSHTEG